MPLTEGFFQSRNAKRLTAGIIIAGALLACDGTRKVIRQPTTQAYGEITLGASIVAVGVMRKNLAEQELATLAIKRHQEVLNNPEAFPLHIIDQWLETEEETRRTVHHVLSHENAQQFKEESDMLKKVRKALRTSQEELHDAFTIDDRFNIPRRTEKRPKTLGVTENQGLVIPLLTTNVEDLFMPKLLRLLAHNTVTPQDLHKDNPVIIPTHWNGVTVRYFKGFIGDQKQQLYLNIDRMVVPTFIKEKPLLPPRYHN